MSLLNFIQNDSKLGKFIIYSNEYLESTTLEEQTKNIVLEFDTILKFEFASSADVSQKNIENSDFRNDSMHDNPNTISMKVVKMRDINSSEAITNERAEQLIRSLTLCTIVNRYPIFKQYNNYKFSKYEYSLDGSCNALVATITFEEVRTGATEFGGENAYDNGALANPENQNQVDSGNVTPKVVTGTPTYLKSVA